MDHSGHHEFVRLIPVPDRLQLRMDRCWRAGRRTGQCLVDLGKDRWRYRGGDVLDRQRQLAGIPGSKMGKTELLGRAQERGAALLRRAREMLAGGKLYDVFAIVERWQESCELLDAVLPLHNVTWSTLLQKHRETHGSKSYKRQELAALKLARANGRIAELLRADIELYQTANATFDRMLNVMRNLERIRIGLTASEQQHRSV